MAVAVQSPKTKVCELWWSEATSSHAFFPEDNASARAALEPDAVLEWKTEAVSWKDACEKRHAHFGWGPYEPDPDARNDWSE